MNMKCRDLLELRCFEQIKLVGGESGLDNMITWVYINQDVSITDWIHGGELVFMTGLDGHCSEDILERLIRECVENVASGVVIVCNPQYIENVPRSIITIADAEGLPIFEMPWELKLVDVTKEIANNIIMKQLEARSAAMFFSELLFDRHISENSLKSVGLRCGVNIDEPALIIMAHIVYPESCGTYNERTRFENALELFRKQLSDCLYSKRCSFVSSVYMDEIFIYLNCSENSSVQRICSSMRKFAEKFSAENEGLCVYGGFGSICTNLKDIHRSCHEAEQAMAAARKSGGKAEMVLFSKLGIISLLADNNSGEQLKDYCRNTLKPLIDSDYECGTEYLKTLRVFLNCNCSMVNAAKAMYIHRNTLVYRIDKIRNLLDIDFGDMTAKCECMNALRIMNHFGFTVSELHSAENQ